MLKHLPFAPLALAIFPVLSLLASNLEEVSLDISISPQVIILGVI